MRAGFPRQPDQEPAQGAGDPTGCSSGTIKKLPMTSPSAGRTTATGAVLYCNPAADTEGRVILPDWSPEQQPTATPHAAAGWAVVEPHRGCR